MSTESITVDKDKKQIVVGDNDNEFIIFKQYKNFTTITLENCYNMEYVQLKNETFSKLLEVLQETFKNERMD